MLNGEAALVARRTSSVVWRRLLARHVDAAAAERSIRRRLMLSSLGVEGALRTWSFSYLRVAVRLAPVVPWVLSRARSAIGRRGSVTGEVAQAAVRSPWRAG
jgi:hypothetical protein